MLTRCWLPPESRPTSSSARSSRPVCSSIRATAASGSASFSSRANRRRFSATDSFEYSAGCCGTQPMLGPGARRHLALARREHAGEDRQQRRLAGAVGPDDRDQLAGVQLEADRARARSARRSAWSATRAASVRASPGRWPRRSTARRRRLTRELRTARLERGAARAAEGVVGRRRPRRSPDIGRARSAITPATGERVPHGSSTRWRRR